MSRESRPHISELIERCEACGEELDYGREECVTLDCPRYLEVTNSLEHEAVLAHARDTRGGYLGFDDESEVA
jgi:hypothetical protein